MYEVFLNDRKIVITHPGNNSFIKEEVITKNLNNESISAKSFP